MSALRVGTRASALALVQAGWVAERLGGVGVAELVPITTAGDLNRAAGDKSRWTGALEGALVLEEIDLAVHSAKDVPGELAHGLELVAAAGRVEASDVICGAPSLASLPAGARVGTSALRRRAQVLAARDDVEVVELRGNVDTRLRKLADGEVDALVLARAGLERLGRLDDAGGVLDDFIPAAGQGVLLLEARAGDTEATSAAATLNEPEAWVCLSAERALVRALGASCHTPVGTQAVLQADGELHLEVFVGLPDGSEWIRDELVGSAEDPGALAAAMAGRLLAVGAADLLARASAVAT